MTRKGGSGAEEERPEEMGETEIKREINNK